MTGHVHPEILEALCVLLRRGAPLPTACDVVQVKLNTVLGWIDKGTPDPRTGTIEDGYYSTVSDQLRKSMAESQVEALNLVIEAARGYDATETIENFNADGVLKGKTTITKRKRDWRAAAWLLERVWPHHFGSGDREAAIDTPVKEIVINAPPSMIEEMRSPLVPQKQAGEHED